MPPKVVCPISLDLPDHSDSSVVPRTRIPTYYNASRPPETPGTKGEKGGASLEREAVCRPGKAWVCPDTQLQVFLPSQAISVLCELNRRAIVVSTLPRWSSARGGTILHRQSLCSDTLSHLPHPIELISVYSQMVGKYEEGLIYRETLWVH